MTYGLKFHRDVEKQLRRIPKKQKARLASAMRELRDEPRPSGNIKLDDRLYRIRVGQYRVIYAVFDDEVVVIVVKVVRRTEKTYRDLKALLDRSEKEMQEK